MKKFWKAFLISLTALCLSAGIVACGEDGADDNVNPPISGEQNPDGGDQNPDGGDQNPDESVNSPVTFVARADVPDAFSGFGYDLSALVATNAENYALSATAYVKKGTKKTPVTVTDMKITPEVVNEYVYAVITATKASTVIVSEEIAIRVFGGVLEENFRAVAYQSEAYDLKKSLYESNFTDLTATAYYLDGETKIPLTVTDLTVTPNDPQYDCFYAEYAMGAAKTAPVKISLTAEGDAQDKALWLTWGSGLKYFNTDGAYIQKGNTSIKYVSDELYNEETGNYNSGYRVVGSLYGWNYKHTVTDWSNAVLTVQVYNAEDFGLTASLQVRHAESGTNADYGAIVFDLAPGWNTLEYSFRANGINTKPYYDGELAYDGSIQTGAQNDAIWLGVKTTEQAHNFTVYVDGVDITDYSAEKFPTLNTLLPSEIAENKYNSLTGDSHDRLTSIHTLNSSAKLSKWYYTETTAEIISYAEGADGALNIANRPTELAASNTLVKQTIRGTGNESNLASVPLWFDNQKEVGFINSYLEELKDLDWEKAYISFYVYNATGYDLNAYLTYAYSHYTENVAGTMPVAKDTWTKVEFSLASLHIDPAGDYLFGIVLNTWEKGVVTPTAEFTYYVDGFKIYNKEGDEDDLELLNHALFDNKTVKYPGSTAYSVVKYADTAMGKPSTEVGSYAVKGEITWTIADLASIPVYYNNNGYPFAAPSGSDYAKTYVGVWVYAEDCNLTGYLVNGKNEGGTWDTYPAYTKPALQQVKATKGQWTWMEFSLAHLNLDTAESYDFGIRLIGWVTPVEGETITYYVDGLRIFEKEPMEMSTLSANYARAKDTTTLSAEDTDGISYQYTFTGGFAADNNAGIPTALRGRFFHYSATVGNDPLFGLNAETDWANLYCGFWIKKDVTNNIDVLLTFVNTQDGTTYKGSESMTFTSYDYGHKATGSSTEWQYMEFNLAALYPAKEGKVAAYEYFTSNVTAYQIGISTETGAESATFYIDEIKLYSKTAA